MLRKAVRGYSGQQIGNAPEPQAGSRIVTSLMAFQKARSSSGTFAIFDDILSELTNTKIIGDKFVYVIYLTISEFWHRRHHDGVLRAIASRHVSVGKAYASGARVFQSVRLDTSPMPSAMFDGSFFFTPFFTAS